MAKDIVLGIRIKADGTAEVRREMGGVRNELNNAGNAAGGANRQFANMARESMGLGSALKGLAAALSASAIYHYAKGFVQVADEMKLLDSRLKVAASSTEDYIASQKELVDISMRTGTAFEANASMFARINKSMETMGGTARDTTAFIETLAQSLYISGTSAGEAASVIRQMSQAMASGLLRGDEFNSIMENGSRIAYALAAGLQVNVGELRKMAEEGKLTSSIVIKAIMSQSEAIDAEYKNMPLTVSSALENVRTQWGQYIKQVDAGIGATNSIAKTFDSLARNLGPVIDGVIQLGTVIASVYGGQLLVSMGRYIAAKDAAIVAEQAHSASLLQNLQANVAAAEAEVASTGAKVADISATQAAIVVAREESIAKLQVVNVEIARTRAAIAAMQSTVQSTAVQYLHRQAVEQLSIAEQRRSAVLAELASLGAQQARVSVAATQATVAQTAAQNGLTSATAAATAAQRGLTSAFAINPFTGLVVSLSVLVGLLVSAKTHLRDLKSMTVDDKITAIREKISAQKSRIATAQGPVGLLISDEQLKKEKATLAMMKDELGRYYKEKDALKAHERQQNKLLEDQQSKLSAAQNKTLKETVSAAKKAATAEASRRAEVLKTIDALQFELSVSRLADKEKSLQTDLRQKLAKAVGSERDQIESLVVQIHAEADARERQQAMWDEAVASANALDELKDSAAEAQQLAALAEQLKLQGLTNDVIAQRIELEKEKAAAIVGNPDLDPAQVSAYVTARAESEAIIQKLTSNSADEMETAYKRAIENIQDGFADMFEQMLNGDAMKSFETFADNIRKTLNKAISQQLALDLQNLFTGKGSAGGFLQSALVFGAGLAVSLFGKSSSPRTLSPAEVGNSPVLGTGAMHIADSFARDRGYEFQSKTVLAFNKSLEYLSDTIMNTSGNIVDWIGSLGTKLASTSVIQSVAAFFKPVTSMIGQATSFISNIYASLTDLVSKGVTTIGQAIGWTAVGTGAANAGSDAAASAGVSAMQNIAGALTVIKFGFDLFQTWGDGNLTTHKKITNSLYAASDALLSGAAIYANWMAAAAAAVLNIGGVISDVFENGFTSENIGRLIFGPLAGLFMKQRTPNAWMNTFNPKVGSNSYPWDPNARNITEQGNKSSYISMATPFGYTQISTHELSLSAEAMKNAFGGLLETVRTVDINLYDTINRLDKKFGETGRTMDFYNKFLVGGRRIATRQDTSELNTGGMLMDRYNWIINAFAKSGSRVGQAVNAWFDVITEKFMSVSKDNAIMVIGVIDSLADNLENFMQFPLQLVGLIGQSVKSVNQGGTPDSVMNEIMGVLDAFMLVKSGFAQMKLAVDENRIVSFLAQVNAIGYGVQDAGLNLLAYGIALQKINGTIAASGNALMNTVEARFKQLKSQGLDNAQLNAYIGSFGLFANLFAEAKVAFNEGDIARSAMQVHNLSKVSTAAAKNVIDHAIASEKLTHISRQAAIATLVKNGKLEEATVAEAEYGVSVQNATKDVLAQMGFVQQLGYITGKSLGEMGVSALSWQFAAKNVVNVFGDMETAMGSIDDIARSFLSAEEYNRYNLDTVNRGLANLRSLNPELDGLDASGVTAALKSGREMANFIVNKLAKGNGELAKSTLEYVQLLGRQMALEKERMNIENERLDIEKERLDIEKELTAQIDQMLQSFIGFFRNTLSVRYSIAKNINSLGGTSALTPVSFQQDVIDKLYDFLNYAATDPSDKINIINDINQAVMDRYNAELEMLGQVSEAVKRINDYLDNLKLGDKSPLTNMQKLAEAQSQYATQLAMARAGDQDALANITNAADDYLTQARVVYASSENYSAIFNSVTSALEALTAPSMGEAAYQAEVLRLQDATVSELAALDATLQSIYFGKQADVLVDWYTTRLKLDGSHAGGLDYVPFDGYRAELHKGERVLTAAQARRQDGENGQALIAELRALRAEVAQLRAEQRNHTGALIQSNYDANDRASDKIVTGTKEASKDAYWANKSKVAIV